MKLVLVEAFSKFCVGKEISRSANDSAKLGRRSFYTSIVIGALELSGKFLALQLHDNATGLNHKSVNMSGTEVDLNRGDKVSPALKWVHLR